MLQCQAKVPQVQGTEKKPSRRANEGSLRPKMEKKSSQAAASSTRLMGRLQKPEVETPTFISFYSFSFWERMSFILQTKGGGGAW